METNENERLVQEMIEGYVNIRADRQELNRDWQIVDEENRPAWDEEKLAGFRRATQCGKSARAP